VSGQRCVVRVNAPDAPALAYRVQRLAGAFKTYLIVGCVLDRDTKANCPTATLTFEAPPSLTESLEGRVRHLIPRLLDTRDPKRACWIKTL
jgi:hypothetical protein